MAEGGQRVLAVVTHGLHRGDRRADHVGHAQFAKAGDRLVEPALLGAAGGADRGDALGVAHVVEHARHLDRLHDGFTQQA